MFPPVIKALLISNVAIFVLQILNPGLENFLLKNFAQFPIGSPLFRPWQFITNMFLHGSFGHLFFNMFALWMFGVEIENLWGTKKFLIFYLICGIGASLANYFINPLFMEVPLNVPTIGASGAVYGVLVAFAYFFPERYIYIYFMIPVKAKYLIIFYIALEVFYTISMQNTGIAHLAHLGGAVVGFVYLLIFFPKNLSGVFNKIKKSNLTDVPFFRNEQPPKYEPPQYTQNTYDAKYEDIQRDEIKAKQKAEQQMTQEKIDSILDKIAKSGYQNLTDEEKRILFEESKKLR